MEDRSYKPPSSLATYERARRLAGRACFAVAAQRQRITEPDLKIGQRHATRWMDFEFLIYALTRLRRAAVLATKADETNKEIETALAQFDAVLPNLKAMRDVIEHIDEYAIDRGHNRAVSRSSLEVAVVGKDQLEWIGHTLDVDRAVQASGALYRVIKQHQPLRGD